MISVEDIWKVVKNKYEAVMVAAKEAKRVNIDEADALAKVGEKPIMRALKRLVKKKIKYTIQEK